jgi:hypothetical protein
MPLTPEQIRRIEQEERLRVEQDLERARARRPARPPMSSGVKLAGLFALGFLLASLVIAFRWHRDDGRSPNDSRRTRTPQTESPPAVFGEKPAPAAAPNDGVRDRARSREAAAMPTDPALYRQSDTPIDEARPAPVAPQKRDRAAVMTVTEVPADIVQFLSKWENSLEKHDLATQENCYARVVDRFYTKSNVSQKDVMAEKRRMLQAYPKFNKYEISNIRVESLTGDRASLTFDKNWDASGRKRFAGSEQQRLVLIKVSGEWKIVREEETRVYWVRRT